MRKAASRSGKMCLFYKAEIGVSGNEFIMHLTDHSYGNDDDLSKLTKSEAKEIVRKGIRQYGRNGNFDDSSLGSDTIPEYNKSYKKALDWTEKNYPFLFEEQ